MNEMVLNGRLNLLPPKNTKDIRDKIQNALRSFTFNVKVGKVDTSKALESLDSLSRKVVRPVIRPRIDVKYLNDRLQKIKLQKVKLNFDVTNVKADLKAGTASLDKIPVNFNVSSLRGTLRDYLSKFRNKIYFDVTSLQNDIARAIRVLHNRGAFNLPVNITDIKLSKSAANKINSVKNGISNFGGNGGGNGGGRGKGPNARDIGNAANEMERFGNNAMDAIIKFGTFSVVTSAFYKLISAMSSGVKEAIAYDREMVRLAQVSGYTVTALKEVDVEVNRLSKSFGVNGFEILNAGVTLAQAGLTIKDTKVALEALAKTGLSSSFGDIKDTTEASIAIFQQFGIQADALESTLSRINTVSAKYAVEAGDITIAIQRAGGAFAAAGGQIDEFNAIFTSIRQTTRESAETISTGLRTIFTRMQRGKTQNFLKNMGIDLTDAEGQFIGPLDAVRRLSEALKQLPSTDPRYMQIVEELGGFRQVSRVIPMIQKFDVTQKALNDAMRAGSSLSKDAAIAQQSLAVQIAKVREEFMSLMRTIAGSDSFKAMTNMALSLSSAIIKLAASLETLLPMMGVFAITKGASLAKSFGTGAMQRFGSKGIIDEVVGSSNASPVGARSPHSRSVSTRFLPDTMGGEGSVLKAGSALTGLALAATAVTSRMEGMSGIFGELTNIAGNATVAMAMMSGTSQLGRAFRDKMQTRSETAKTKDGLLGSGNFVSDHRTRTQVMAGMIANSRGDIVGASNAYAAFRRVSPMKQRSGIGPDFGGGAIENGYNLQEQRVLRRKQHFEDMISNSDARYQTYVSGGMDPVKARTKVNRENRKATKFINPTDLSSDDYRSQLLSQGYTPEAAEKVVRDNETLKGALSKNQSLDTSHPIHQRAHTETDTSKVYSQLRSAGLTHEQAQSKMIISDRNKSIDSRNLDTVGSRARKYMNEGYSYRDSIRMVSKDRSNESWDRAGNKIAIGATIAAVMSPYLSSYGRGRAAEGKGGLATYLSSGAGGAGEGAATGATLGMSFGPQGAAIGAVIGGLAGLARALTQTTETIRAYNINKEIKNTLNNVDRANRGTATSFSTGISDDLNTSWSRISTLSTNDKINARNEFIQNAPQIEEFFRNIAVGSKTFEEFDSKTKGSLASFASLADIPYDKMKEQYVKQIEAQNAAVKSMEQYRAAHEESMSIKKRMNAFLEAITISSIVAEKFASRIGGAIDVINGSIGSGVVGSQKDSLEAMSSGLISDRNLINSVSQSIFGSLGKPGEEFSKEFGSAAELMNKLPDILTEANRENAFSPNGTLVDRIEDRMAGFNPEIVKAVVNSIKRNIDTSTDDNLKKEIESEEGVAQLIGNTKQALQEFFSVAESFSARVENQKKLISDAMNSYATAILKAADMTIDIASKRNERDNILFEAQSENPVPVATLFRQQQDAVSSAFGSSNLSELEDTLKRAASESVRIQGDMSNPNLDVTQYQKLSDELSYQKIQFEKSRNALDALSNSTEALSAAQKKLVELEKKRAFQVEGLDTMFMGSAEDKTKLNKDIESAIKIAVGGLSAVQNMTASEREGGWEYIKKAAEAGVNILPGVDSKETLRMVREQMGAQLGLSNKEIDGLVSPGKTDESLNVQNQIKEIMDTNIAAMEILRDTQLDFASQIKDALVTENNRFLVELKQLLKDSQVRGVQGEKSLAISERDSVALQLNNSNELRRRFGANADTPISEMRRAQELLIERKALENEKSRLLKSEGDAVLRLNGMQFNPDTQTFDEDGSIVKEISRMSGEYGFDPTKALDNARYLKSATISGSISPENAQKYFDRIRGDIAYEISKSLDTGKVQEKLDSNRQSISDLSIGRGALIMADDRNLDESIKKNKELLAPIDENKTAYELISTLKNLNENISRLNKEEERIKGMATGGLVRGFGTRDSVPTKLMPKEYVIKASAARVLGEDFLNNINNVTSYSDARKVLSTGASQVSSGGRRFSSSTSTVSRNSSRNSASASASTGSQSSSNADLRQFIDSFNKSISTLTASINNIPKEITLTATHKVEVVFNGAQVLTQIMPEVQKLVVSETKASLNKFIDSKFPHVGKV